MKTPKVTFGLNTDSADLQFAPTTIVSLKQI
jgi:hypothetical protein